MSFLQLFPTFVYKKLILAKFIRKKILSLSKSVNHFTENDAIIMIAIKWLRDRVFDEKYASVLDWTWQCFSSFYANNHNHPHLLCDDSRVVCLFNIVQNALCANVWSKSFIVCPFLFLKTTHKYRRVFYWLKQKKIPNFNL